MNTAIIVAGTINTDIVAVGVNKFAAPGAPVYGGLLQIGPGGKSRNIAQMIAVLINTSNIVAMIARTTQDPVGIWKPPIEALEKVGVNTSKIKVVSHEDSGKQPSIALNAVTTEGTNVSYIVPGVSDDFSVEDIDNADSLFIEAASNDGIFALSLECPLNTARHAIDKAYDLGLRVVLDLGGIESHDNVDNIVDEKLFLIKPNEYEARLITGINVTDFDSAKAAAQELFKRGVRNVLITNGSKGAYLFTDNLSKHIPIPNITSSGQNDDTGCGDQTMAALCAYIYQGKEMEEAATLAVLAGTLEYHKVGIDPVTSQEVEAQA